MPARTNSGRELATATIEESSMAKVAAKGVSKLLTLVTPWVVGLFGFGLAAALHFILYSPDSIGAWSSVVTVCVITLTGVTYGTSHARGAWGKTHTTVSTLLAGVWTVAVVNLGPGHPALWRLGVVGGITMALSWNIRSVIRMKGWDEPGTGAVTDPLSFLFGQGARNAGMKEIEARTTKATPHKVEFEVQLEQGRHTADDLQKKLPYIESGAGLPPGSITTATDADDASKAKGTLSDPRVMRSPIPWPGASRPGASVAEPVRAGLWQDLDELEYTLVGHHLQVMGQTGSGKSIGGAWNLLGELITRYDVAIFAGDITKGDQTLGPMREALHRFETTKAGVKAMLADLQAQIKPRTNHLAGRGLQKWLPGCGLTYWIVWLEEFPDIFDALTDSEQEKFLSMLKAIRSAGGTIVMSLQRSDYSQMPTLARGQLARMCFGVDSPADASFGLSERQQDAGARPELWTNAQPGMAYLDAPSIGEERIAMPLRTFAWGMKDGRFDDEAANAAMREHAGRWPAAGKEVDPTTARLSVLAGGTHPRADWPVEREEPHDPDQDENEDEEDVRSVAAEYLATDDPDPDIAGDLDDEIPDLPDGRPPLTFAPPEQTMTPQQRGQALLRRLQELWDDGGRDFSSGDLKPLWESTDMSRAWVQKQLKRLLAAGVLGGYDDDAQRYLMPDRPELAEAAA